MSSPPSNPKDVATALGLSASQIKQFMNGEVVTHELDASSDKDLSLCVVAVVGASVERAWEFVDEERVPEIQEATLSTGIVDVTAMSLDDMDLSESTVKKLMKKPFMSKEEANMVKEALKEGKGVDAYKLVMADRARAYWNRGLEGIIPYDGKGRDPQVDLRNANDAVLKIMKDPTMRSEIASVPSKSPNPTMHSLRWAVQDGNDGPTPLLNHVVRLKLDDRFLSVTRRFYSGADCDASQIVAGALPTSDGRTAIFYTNRTYTSSVAGFGGTAKRAIGRKIMKGKLVDTFKKAQVALSN